MYRQVEFTGQSLFATAWSTSVLKVAAEIGVSDVTAAKACRQAGIPLPRCGHWAFPRAAAPSSLRCRPPRPGTRNQCSSPCSLRAPANTRTACERH